MSKTELRIAALTDDMRASFPAFVEEWTAIGRSTDEIDYPNAIRAVRMAWAAAGLAAPFVLFTRSPIEALFARDVLDARSGVGSGVGSGVESGVESDVWSGVWSGVASGVWSGVWSGVRSGVWSGVESGVWSGVRSGVASGVASGVRSGWRPQAAWWEQMLFGCHDAGWLSFYDWFRRHGLADICAPLDGLTLLAKSAGWTIAHENIAIVSDRPLTLHDEPTGNGPHERRLHNANGPAVTYADGWSIWAWHGTNVPAWVIEECTLDKITAESNTEIRRCAIERYGWDRYLAGVGATPIDTADDPGNPGHTLELFDVPDDVYDGDVRLLVMRNASRDRDGSRRTFAETVPASCRSAVDAAAWQFDIEPDVYRQLARAT